MSHVAIILGALFYAWVFAELIRSCVIPPNGWSRGRWTAVVLFWPLVVVGLVVYEFTWAPFVRRRIRNETE